MKLNFLSGLVRRSVVGVDIGASSIKVVELSATGNGQYRIERCSSELLERGVVVDGNITKIDVVSEAIRRALMKAGIRNKNAVLGIPLQHTESQTISLPDDLGEDELYAQVESEANRLFPPSVKVNFDFAVIGPNETEGGIGVRVTAANGERVDERAAAAESAGLKPMIMDVEEFAMLRGLHHALNVAGQTAVADPRKRPVTASVQLGGSHSRIAFYQGEDELYDQNLSVYGDQLTQSISKSFTLEVNKAEVKKRKNTLPEAYANQLLKPALESLGSEVSQAIQNFLSSTSVGHVDEIVLSGGHALLTGAVSAVQRQTQIPTSLVDPFAHMDMAKGVNPKYLQRELPAYLLACGLAMRGLQAKPAQ